MLLKLPLDLRGWLWVCHSPASSLSFPSCCGGARILGQNWAWLPLASLPRLPAAQEPISAQPGALCPCPSDAAGCWSSAPLILTLACRPRACPVPTALPGYPGLWLSPVPHSGPDPGPTCGEQPSTASARPHGEVCMDRNSGPPSAAIIPQGPCSLTQVVGDGPCPAAPHPTPSACTEPLRDFTCCCISLFLLEKLS